MLDYDTLLAQYAGAPTSETTPAVLDTKQAVVANASAKKIEKFNGQVAYDAVTANRTGYGKATLSPEAADVVNLDPAQLYNKYGYERASQLIGASAAASGEVTRDATRTRDFSQAVGDTAIDVSTGVLNGVGGIAALGLGLVNSDAGTEASRLLEEANQWGQAQQSDSLNARRRFSAAQSRNADRDSNQLYEQSGKSFTDSLSRIGRDVINAVSIGASDNQTLTSGIGQGVGSMLMIGPMGKALKGAGGLLIGAERQAAIEAAGGLTAKVAELTPNTLAIGAQTGGGIYASTVQDALETMKNRTDLSQEQKQELANDAGLRAAGVGIPLSLLAGAGVARFEGNPLAKVSLSTAMRNVGKETIEEGVQSGAEGYAQNKGIQERIDPTRDLTKGVGQQIGEGGLYGFGTAAVLQAPDSAKNAVVSGTGPALRATAKLLTALGTPLYNYIAAKGEAVSKAIDAKAPNATVKTAEIVKAAQASFTEGLPVVEQAIQDTDGTPEEKIAATQYIRDFARVTGVDMSQVDGSSAPDVIKEMYSKSANKAELLDRLEEFITFGKGDDSTKLVATQMVYGMAEEIASYSENLPELLTKIPKNSPAAAYIQQFDDVATEVNGTLAIQAVRKDFNKRIAEIQSKLLKPVDEATIATPRGQENVQNHLAVAAIAPDKADEKALNIISMQAARGKVNLTDSQKLHLTTAQTLLSAAREYQAEAARLGLRKTDVVNGQITVDEDRTAEGEKSAFTHATGVRFALSKGNTELAKKRLEDFMKFAQHMSNKVGALNEHFRTGNGDRNKAVGFAALDPVTREFIPSELKLAVNPRSQGSLSFAQRVSLEANTVGGIANALAQAYPELGVQPVTVEPLAPALLQKFDAKSPIKSPKADPKKEATTPEVKIVEKKSISAMSLDELNAEAAAFDSDANGAMSSFDKARYVGIRVEIESRNQLKAAEDTKTAKERAEWVKTLSDEALDNRLEGVDRQDDPELFKVLNDEITRRKDATAQKKLDEAKAVSKVKVEKTKEDSKVFIPKNAEQAEGIKKIQEFLSDSKAGDIFVLEGKAGTGKTTIMQEALRNVLKNRTVTIAAVSHKAKAVLDEKLKTFVKNNNLLGGVDSHSIASLLGMRFNANTGEFEFSNENVRKAPIVYADYLVIDEASMIDAATLKLIMEYKPKSTKVILLGDIGQLAPVEGSGKVSPVFTLDVPRYKLLERVRQGEDSNILPYADNYWNNSQVANPVVNPIPLESRKNNKDISFVQGTGQMLAKVLDIFREAVKDKKPNKIKIIAYNNKEGNAKAAPNLARLEQKIRTSIFGENPKIFEEGDLVILNDNFDYGGGVQLENASEYSVVASKEAIKKLKVSFSESTLEVPIFNVDIIRNDGARYNIPVLSKDADTQAKFKGYFNNLASAIKAMPRFNQGKAWAEFYELKGKFASLAYAYVITSHKAQGSTYEISVVLEDNFLNASQESSANKSRGIYTAITRASSEVIIVSSLNPEQLVEYAKPKAAESAPTVRDESDIAPVVEAVAADKPSDKKGTETVQKIAKAASVQEEPKQLVGENILAAVDDTNNEPALDQPTFDPEGLEVGTPEYDEALTEWIAEQEAERVAAQEKSEGIVALYPNLYRGNGITNFLHEAFTVSLDRVSRLVGIGTPIAVLRNAIKSTVSFSEFIGKQSETKLTKQAIADYSAFLDTGLEIKTVMEKHLQSFLKTGNVSNETKFRNGVEANRWMNGKLLNIVEQTPKGFEYNQELLEGAILAGMQWMLSAPKYRNDVEKKDVTAFLRGTTTVDDLPEYVLNAYRRGFTHLETISAITKKIQEYWGLQGKSSADVGYTLGIPQNMAIQVFTAMQELKLIEVEKISVDSGISFELYRAVDLPEDAIGIRNFKNLIDKLVLPKPEQEFYLGDSVPSVPKNIMRSPYVKNTRRGRKAIQAAINTKYYLNLPMIESYESLGLQNMLLMFGNGELDKDSYNKNDLEAKEGQNLALTSAFGELIALKAQVDAFAEVANVEPDQVNIHYGFNMSSVSRLQMLGSFTPQSSKAVREAVLPTRSTLNLSANRKPYKFFFLGLAQALGEKIGHYTLDESVAKAQKILTVKLKESVGIAQQFLTNGYMPEGAAQDIKSNFNEQGIELSHVAWHAVLEYARFTLQEDKTAFTTSIYVEADGITNGMMNSMAMLTTGYYTISEVENLAKGGLFFNGVRTNAEHWANDQVDLYKSIAGTLQGRLQGIKATFAGTKLDNNLKALNDLFDMFLSGADLNESGDLTVSRNVAKNPATITLYGSGAEGISYNIANEILSAIYARMSLVIKAKQNDPKAKFSDAFFAGMPGDRAQMLKKFNNAVEVLTNQAIVTEFGKLKPDTVKHTKALSAKHDEFTVDGTHYYALASNIQHLFVKPLRESIAETVGESVIETSKLIGKATQIQSVILENIFRQEVAKKLEEKAKDSKWRQSDFLSISDQREIFKKLSVLSPFIQTEDQTFFIAGKQNVRGADGGSNPNISSSFEEKYRTEGFLYGPANSGVAGRASIVIGTGDGNTMQLALTDPKAPTKALPVFDGINLALDNLEQDSEVINKAVKDAWKVNTIASLVTSYSNLINSINSNVYDNVLIADLTALFFPFGSKKPITPDVLKNKLADVKNNLEETAIAIQNRLETRDLVDLRIDQMAGVGSSTHQKGIELGVTSQEIVKKLNGILSKNTRKNSDISSKSEEKSISTLLKEYGRTLKNGAVELNWTSLFRLSNVLSIPQDRLETFSEILKSFNTKDYKVIFGTAEQIAEYQTASNYQKLTAEQAKKLPKGYTVYSDKAIYIVNPTTETLIHELIHAATFEKIYDHYLNKTSNGQITQSVANLETLMKQFLEMEKDISFLSEETLNAYLDTKFAIETELNKTSNSAEQLALNKTHALNEFMAWTLSNESLVKTLKLTEANPVVLFLSKVIRGIKKLIWGNNIAPYVGTDMFSNIKFNTAIIVKSKPTVVEMSDALVSFQSSVFGNNERLVKIREALSKKVYEYLQSGSNIIETEARSLESANAKINSLLYKKVAEDHHFAMTPQERSTYLQVVHSLATLAEIDPTALAKAQDTYSHVVKTLTVEDFMSDPQSQNPADRAEAQDKYNVILGNFGTRRDSFGRTGLLSNFMGLALVNEQFRDILAKMDMPEPIRNVDKDLNSRLENLGFAAVDALAEHLSNTRNSPNVQRAIDGLTERIVETIQDDEQVIERYTKPVGNFVDNANQYIVENASRLAKAGITKAESALSDPKTNRATRVVANASKLILSLVSEDDAQRVAEGVISNANRIKLWTPIRELLSDFVGRTDSNAAVYDLIKRVRVFVQQTRQQYRENVPTVIASKFTRSLADEEWTLLFNGLAKTDLASLAQNKQVGSIVALLQDPKKVDAEIARLTAEIRSNDPKNAQTLLKKSEQLATYMTTGKVGNNLLRNAYSIARLFNEKVIGRVNTTQQSEENIDRLVSLMALNMMPKVDRDSLTSLVQEQPEGISFALSYLVGQRKDEMYKANTPTVMANYYKGYVPSESTSGLSLLIVKDNDYGQAAKMSYRDVGYYEGSSADRFKGKRTYMFAPVTAKADYSQGIMQNIRQTAGGVDMATGLSHDVMTAGAITKPELVRQTLALMHKETGAEPLLPVFDPSGKIIAFERSVNPDHLQLVKPNTHLAKMLGVWRGRQVEQINAQVFNETLVDSLFSMYQKDITRSPSSQAEYVDLFAVGNDPVIVDAMKLLTKPARDYIKAKFGDEFWVRKEMVNDAIGFRAASIGDVWTGNSRWSPRTLEEVQKLALGVFGNKAYQYLTAAEKTVQNYIKDARVLIVVKSMIVPAANLVSTTLQLVARGVPLADIVRGMPRKTAEVNSYIRTQLRKVEAEAELRAATGDIRATRRLTVEIQGIVDGHKRLSIWPLIQAGEFSAISDAGISRDEILLSEGRLHAYMESLVAKLPLSVQTAGKYALITKDTALFQGIQKVMEYGDFLGKALLYDDLVKRQKQTPAYALGRVSEEFVNYDRLSGRWRSYLENTGMLWFYNYKIRIAKIAASMVRNNPVHALLGMLVPLPDAIGLPIEDNVFSKAIEGTLPYSMGLGQALRAPMLNPWANLIN